MFIIYIYLLILLLFYNCVESQDNVTQPLQNNGTTEIQSIGTTADNQLKVASTDNQLKVASTDNQLKVISTDKIYVPSSQTAGVPLPTSQPEGAHMIISAIANPSLVNQNEGVSFDIMYDLKDDEFKEIKLRKSDNPDVLFTFSHDGKKSKSRYGIGPRISDLSNHQLIHLDHTIEGDEGDYIVTLSTKNGRNESATIYLGVRGSAGKDKDLILSGVMPDYFVNSTLVAICDLQQMLLPLELKFLINDQFLNERYVTHMYEVSTNNRKVDVYREMEITLTKEYIRNSRVKVTCMALNNNRPMKETSETATVTYPRNFCGYAEAKKTLL